MAGSLQTEFYPASIEQLYDMQNFVRTQALTCEFSKADLIKIELALEEAIVNILRHGELNAGQEIQINCGITKDLFEVVIMDSGTVWDPFSRAKKVDISSSLEKRKVGGLGVLIMMKSTTEVKFHHLGNINILRLLFKRT